MAEPVKHDFVVGEVVEVRGTKEKVKVDVLQVDVLQKEEKDVIGVVSLDSKHAFNISVKDLFHIRKAGEKVLAKGPTPPPTPVVPPEPEEPDEPHKRSHHAKHR